MAIARSMGVAALILSGFALVGTSLVAVTFTATRDIIAENEQAALLTSFNVLLPPEQYDNPLTQDSIQIIEPDYLGTPEPVTVYRACRQRKPVALLARIEAPDGYSGPIKLLIGVYADGTLAGVRVLSHKETPGLGDAIETARSDWMLAFTGKSLGNPPLERWAVKKDGGAFDQFSGATITPRAVVSAVRRFLAYFQQHREQLFQSKDIAEQNDNR